MGMSCSILFGNSETRPWQIKEEQEKKIEGINFLNGLAVHFGHAFGKNGCKILSTDNRKTSEVFFLEIFLWNAIQSELNAHCRTM